MPWENTGDNVTITFQNILMVKYMAQVFETNNRLVKPSKPVKS